MKILLQNSNQFPLKGTHSRFWHIATLQRAGKQYMVFKDRGVPYISGEKMYIEEISPGGQLLFIEDEELANELSTWAREHGFLTIKPVGWY